MRHIFVGGCEYRLHICYLFMLKNRAAAPEFFSASTGGETLSLQPSSYFALSFDLSLAIFALVNEFNRSIKDSSA